MAFYTSGGEELHEFAEEYYTKLDEGFSLEGELIETAIRAFANEPEENQDLKELLLQISAQLTAIDDYEAALRITQAMVENQIEDTPVYQNAADAAFACSEFELAEQYLSILAKSESRESPAKRRLRMLPIYRKEWQIEQKPRKLQHLKQLGDPRPIRGRRCWDTRRACMFLGLAITLAATLTLAFLWMRRPAEFDPNSLTLLDTWSAWMELRQGLDNRVSPYTYQKIESFHMLRTQSYLCIALGVVGLLITSVAFLLRRRRVQRQAIL